MPNDKSRKRRPEPDKLPPHSVEAEAGVLGCILLSPGLAITEAREKINADAFYDFRHQTIFAAMVKLANDNIDGFDEITLRQELKDSKKLADAGGREYLNTLPDATPSAANLSHYLDIVLEKYHRRNLARVCTDLAGRAMEDNGDAKDLISDAERDFRKLFSRESKSELVKTVTWQQLLDYDTDNDPNCIIGFKDGKTTRFLCRGNGAWLIGPSGAGKSSMLLTLGASFALGESIWGIAPVKPCRVLLIQAENDDGDLSEMVKGIDAGLHLNEFGNEERNDMVKQNFLCRSVKGKIGEAFCRWIEEEIKAHKADIVIVDPLLSFAGIEISNQKQVTEFLRLWLEPVLYRTGAVMISVHHTGKPRVEKGKAAPQTLLDMAYAGIGSSELVNWARAILLVQQVDDYNFKLVLAKRGRRAWATHPNGEFTQILWLKHAAKGIFWEQVEPPKESEDEENKPHSLGGRPSKKDEVLALGIGNIIDKTETPGLSQNKLVERIRDFCQTKNITVSRGTAQQVITHLVANNAVKKVEGMYVKY